MLTGKNVLNAKLRKSGRYTPIFKLLNMSFTHTLNYYLQMHLETNWLKQKREKNRTKTQNQHIPVQIVNNRSVNSV